MSAAEISRQITELQETIVTIEAEAVKLTTFIRLLAEYLHEMHIIHVAQVK
jgi:hypothetical protein